MVSYYKVSYALATGKHQYRRNAIVYLRTRLKRKDFKTKTLQITLSVGQVRKVVINHFRNHLQQKTLQPFVAAVRALPNYVERKIRLYLLHSSPWKSIVTTLPSRLQSSTVQSRSIVFTSAGFNYKHSAVCDLDPLFRGICQFIKLMRGLAKVWWVLYF